MQKPLPSKSGRWSFLLTTFLLLTVSGLSAQLSVEVSGINAQCFGMASGSATATVSGGDAPYNYSWSNGGETRTIENLTAGTYTVTVTDNNGASAQGAITLTQPDAITATISGPDQCNAPYIIAAEPAGGQPPYQYNWSTGADTRAISVQPGEYCVTIVDGALCGTRLCKIVEDNPTTVELIDVDVECNGDASGTITANPTGGVAPYTFAWNTGATTATISNLTAGAYRVTLTDARGCSAAATTAITEPPALTASIQGDATVCPGASTAILNVGASGGTPPYRFSWSNGVTDADGIGGLSAGTYSVTVTDANACTFVDDFTVRESTAPNITIEGQRLLCGATTRGTLSARPVSGPISQYTYAWSNGATGSTIANLTAGTYTVTATDGNGCTATASATLRTIDLTLVVTGTQPTCAGDSDGTATANVSGGDMPYTFEWNTGATTASITGLSAGVYTVTVTEENGCKASGSVRITDPAPLNLTATPANTSCAEDNDGRINLTVTGGMTPYTFNWNDGSTDEDRENLAAGTYTVTVTDANGCTDNATIRITSPAPIVANGTVSPVRCNGESSGRISLSVSGGAGNFSFAWSNGAITRDLTNIPAGGYTVTVTDANECTVITSFTVAEPAAIIIDGVVSNVACADDATGSIDLTVTGGSGNYGYAWSTGATTQDVSGLRPATYTVTVTDANQCRETMSFLIQSPDAISLNAMPVNVTCNGEATGSINLTASGGVQPYSYAWSNGATTEDLSNIAAGTYTVTVTDANSCTETVSVAINQPTPVGGTANITPVACTGESTGAINLSPSGGTPGYTYLWSNNATTQDISGLPAGSYTVTITDANSCTLIQTYQVGTVAQLQVTGSVTNASCNEGTNGRISLTVEGGSGTYAYAWSNNATTRVIENLSAGDYTVTVSDANECSIIETFTVTEPNEVTLAITSPDIVCGGTATGLIEVFPAGGTGPYTYLWSNGETGNRIENVNAGSYTVTVTDANGCTDVTSGIILGELPSLSCAVIVEQEATMGSNGKVYVNVDGGTAPFSYLWSNGATTDTIDNLAGGTYSVTVTDFNNCTTECTATLRQLSGIGDFVWIDTIFNGQQDPGEPGLADYPVALKDAAGNIIARDTTDENGFYSFMGLEPGTYSILFIVPPGGDRTLFNVGDDATDNDADPAMDGMTRTYTLAPGEFNMTVDAGFIQGTDGPIVDPCKCLNNNTTEQDGQFSEIFEIIAGPNQTWTITESVNMFQLEFEDGTAPPVPPVPVAVGTTLRVLGDAEPDPVFGRRVRYGLEVRIVDSLRYRVTATNGVQSFSVTNQCFYPDVRLTTEVPEEICREEAAVALAAMGFYLGESLPGRAVFTVNGVEVTSLDPSTLPAGEVLLEAQFLPDPPIDENNLDFCLPVVRRTILIIDECPAKLGDFVWEDTNGNGIQDPGEPGLAGVKVTVTNESGDYMDMTTTDENGMYMFSVPPGTYKMTFAEVEGFHPTLSSRGNDEEVDNDMFPATMMTPFYTVGPNGQDFTIDAGFEPDCPGNIVDPGTIRFSQELCGPGIVPQPFVELVPASGGVGPIEYLWMFNVRDQTEDISFWTPIANSNTPNYQAGPISQTTYFVRCVRRAGCIYRESNVITIEVGDDAVAEISGPRVACENVDVIFEAVNPSPGAIITWNFSGASNVESATGQTATTSYFSFGSFNVTLTVEENGCVSTQTKRITVTRNPNICGGNLVANGGINNLQQRDVTIEWEVPMDGTTEYEFALERSLNGVDFEEIAAVMDPAFVSTTDMATYRRSDVSPLAGRTFYRVRMIDAVNGDMLSNVVEMQLAGATTALGRVFPNPARNGMMHVEMTDIAERPTGTSLQLFDANGNAVSPVVYTGNVTGVVNLPTAGRPAGLYFLRIVSGDRTETHRVIVND